MEEGHVTITFDNGVTQIVEVAIPNSFLNVPEKPNKIGHTFKGWYTARNGGKLWDFSTDVMLNNNLILYAQYTTNWYALVYVDDDGKYETTLTAMYGMLLSNQVEPTRKDAVFLGWYDARTGGNLWDFTTDKMPARDLKLYAQYTANEYVLTYNNDGVISTSLINKNELLLKPTEPLKEGYNFVGWYTEMFDGVMWNFETNTMPSNNLVLYARYTVNSYNVSYFDEEQSAPIIENVTFGTLLSKPVTPIKKGYTFIGWYKSINNGTKWNFTIDTMPAHELNLYARYVSDLYVITYDNDGNKTQQTMKKDTLINEPNMPQKSGYTFKGWYDKLAGGKRWNFATNLMPHHDMILYAQYIAENQTIIFDIAGGDFVSQPADIIQPTNSLVDINGVMIPTRENYRFVGWYNDGVQVFGMINMPVGGMLLVAKWGLILKDEKPYIEARNIEMNLSEVNYCIEQGSIHSEVLLRSEAVIRNNKNDVNYKILYVELDALTNQKNERNRILTYTFLHKKDKFFRGKLLLTVNSGRFNELKTLGQN